MTELLYSFATFQDYGWFLVLLAWGAAAVVWRLAARDNPGWAWLPWTAVPGALAAAIELVSFAWPVSPLNLGVSYLYSDLFLGGLTAVTVAGWIWTLPARRTLRWCAAAAMLGVAIWRLENSILASFVLALSGTLGALGHLRSAVLSRAARVALALAALALWFASSGPLASGWLQPRSLVVFGPWSGLWAGAGLVAAWAALLSLTTAWLAHGGSRAEWRPLWWTGSLLLIGGLVFAAAMSWWARRNFETQLLHRTHAAAAFIDKAAIVPMIDAGLHFTAEPALIQRRDGTSVRRASLPELNEPAAKRARNELTKIERNDPDANFAYFEIPCAGSFILISSGDRSVGHSTHAPVSRPTSDDWLDWSERRSRFMPLLMDWNSPTSPTIFARVPLEHEGRMLGWLMIAYPRSDWLAAQAQPRLQTYFIVALGLGVAALVTLQRVRTREREVARAAASAAMQADQLKTSFLAKVSHELRTPIQSVLGYSDLLRPVVTEPVARGRLRALRQHGELMLRLVNDLLDLSAIQAGAFRLIEKPTAFTDLVTQTIESFRPRAEAKGLVLTLTIEPAVPTWAEMDSGRVRQVLFNLVGNAIKFTDRGVVAVILASGPGEKEVMLTVRDTGPGIAAADRSRLFRSFERLDSTVAKEGTGLGLALSAALCRGMDGDITVESTPGEGATFTARFRAPPCEAPLVADSSGGLPLLAGRRILLADDNALVRELFMATLHDAGATCVAVGDGEAAVVAAKRDNFDAIVLDLSMPRLGGIEAAKQIRAARGRHLRLIGVSAHAGQGEREDALGAGMDAFLVKPVDLGELVAVLAPATAPKRATETGRADLLERLRAQFRASVADESAALLAAIAARDFDIARTRSHYLANSATVVRDDWLYAACAALERAASAGDAAALQAAWPTCEAALEPWIRSAIPAALPAEKNPVSENQRPFNS